MAIHFDVLIRNGTIVDGSGAAGYSGDVGIRGDSIVALGSVPDDSTSDDTVDASGMIVSPGFIDIHTHADIALLARPAHLPKVMQGVTTEVFTNCGLGFAPITDDGIEIQRKFIAGLFGDDGTSPQKDEVGVHRVDWSWRSVAEFLRQFEVAGVGANVVYLIPHGAVRVSVMGMQERAADAAEREKMRFMIAAAMEEGAWGLSTGIWYSPMRAADRAELVTLFKQAGFFATHQRDYGPSLFEATQESLDIAREADIPVQISHLQMNGAANKGKASELLSMLDRARDSGIDVTCDTYPYTAGSTFIQSLLPVWAADGGPEQILRRLASPDDRDSIISAISQLPNNWREYALVGAVSSANARYEGLDFEATARNRSLTVAEWICAVLEEDDLRACYVHHGAHEGNVREILAWDGQMVGSDGLHLPGKTHPRLYGTFPRVLGHYACREKTITLQQAIHKMTGAPADRLGMKQRGLLKPGFAADIVLFDPETAIDTATFNDPIQYPIGLPHVFVNGKAVKRDGAPTFALPGRVLRRNG